MGNNRSVLSGSFSRAKHDPENRETKGFATVQLSTTEFFRKSDPDRKKVFQEGKSTQDASL